MSTETNSTYRLNSDKAWKASAVVAVVGLILSGVGLAMGGTERFGFSYLFGFFVTLTVFLGALFFVISQHITQGHWAVSTRRISELVLTGAPVIVLGVVGLLGGVLSGAFPMYDEWISASSHGDGHGDHGAAHEEHGGLNVLGGTAHAQPSGPTEAEDDADSTGLPGRHGTVETHDRDDTASTRPHHSLQEQRAHHALLAKKTGWLNKTSFAIRAIIYLLVWLAIAFFYYKKSVEQDSSKDKALTVQMARWAPLSAVGFGLSLTFAAFDWLMSIEPTWYSTIFGVVIFAGSALSILAVTILVSLGLMENGKVGDAINVEHLHDHAKLMFGFMCFWTYVSFSQWMLIWYAGIPEEAVFFWQRWEGGWEAVSVFLPIGHFALPFYFLISRVIKRDLPKLKAGVIWLLVMHVVDIFWYVMPNATEHAHLSVGVADVGCLLLFGGAFFAVVFYNMNRVSLIPVGDPRLSRALHHHQSY